MFTGIVQGKARVQRFEQQPGLATLVLEFPLGHLQGLNSGASVAIEGCCLTVVAIDDNKVTFNLIQDR
jgi:riboflavin synthase